MKSTLLEKIFAILAVMAVAGMAIYYFASRPQSEDYRVVLQREGVLQEVAESQAPATGAGEKVDLNTADIYQLQELPGIGEKRARDIVADREANGPFRFPEEITRVSGIGEGTMRGLLDYVTAR